MTRHTDSEAFAGDWFRVIKRSAKPRARLICFPHAGGAASFFQAWADLLPDDMDLAGVRYPGREDRFLDPPPVSMSDLADPVARACLTSGDVPLLFFGHSMGASVAYEVALRMQYRGGSQVTDLFVSGSAAPGRGSGSRDPLTMTDAEIREDVAELGGADANALADQELWELLIPSIRADYRLIGRYRAAFSARAPLDVPMVAYYGRGDADVDAASVAAWAEATSSTFAMRSFDGGHFYLKEQAPGLVADLLGRRAPSRA
ncbi:thioesterase II family protein [Actinacidiphila glaucinigra]|uniref:thioesterase II family protein n=1 Tax=Actinacidiphila glaucinigra TaxID=235986 RepID=UPI00366E95D2